MDDKKINLMPDDLRSKEDQSKRSTLKFNPDFKLPGQKEKFKEPKASGHSGPSFWSKIFKSEKKEKISNLQTPPSFAPGQAISYNNESSQNKPKVEMDLHKPEPMAKLETKDTKVEEHIQEFVPAGVKPAKVKGPSFWSKIFKSKPKSPKNGDSALSNGLKYNGNGTLHQPQGKSGINVLQELNKQAEDTDNISYKMKKPIDQVNVEPTPPPSFDLTKKVVEEIAMQPIEPVVKAPVAEVKVEKVASDLDFAMPELKTAPVATPNQNANTIPEPINPKPANNSRFHLPEKTPKNNLITGGVDLIPAAARVRSWKQIGSLLFFAVILSLLILGGIYGYLVYDEQRIITKQNAEKQRIADIEKSILDFSQLNKDINQMGQDIQMVQEALDKHIYWTKFFTLLEKYTVKDVYYAGLSAGTNGGLTLSASTESYDSVAKQLKVLTSAEAKEFVSSATISGAKRDKEGRVSFEIVMILNPDLFYYTSTQP